MPWFHGARPVSSAGARRRAGGHGGIAAAEAGAFARDAVEVRRVDGAVAVRAQAVGAELVRHQQQDIRPRARLRAEPGGGQRRARLHHVPSAGLHALQRSSVRRCTGGTINSGLTGRLACYRLRHEGKSHLSDRSCAFASRRPGAQPGRGHRLDPDRVERPRHALHGLGLLGVLHPAAVQHDPRAPDRRHRAALCESGGNVTVTYQAMADPDGSINSTSQDKTNFWQYVQALYGAVAGSGYRPRRPGHARRLEPAAGHDFRSRAQLVFGHRDSHYALRRRGQRRTPIR